MARFRKKTFLRRIRTRFLVRFHMALILVGTFLSGLLASKVLLESGIGAMAVRYPLAVLVSYLAFFLFWVAAVTLAVALAAGHYFPHARKIADLFTNAG